jgi:hypothetical protein
MEREQNRTSKGVANSFFIYVFIVSYAIANTQRLPTVEQGYEKLQTFVIYFRK